MARARHALAAGLLLAASSSGCAHGRGGTTTWEDDARDGVLARARAPVPERPARLTEPTPTYDPIDIDPEAAARRLERALLEFGAARRRRGLGSGARAGWSGEEILLWRSLLEEIERALIQPEGVLPRRLLVQIRVVLEAEREKIARTAGPPPEDVDHRVARAFVGVARRLRARQSHREAAADHSRFTLDWPVTPIILTSSFGYRRDPVHRDGRLGFHAGIDLAGGRGDEVYASARGEVIAAGWNGGLGRAVFVQHEGGFVTVYGHLSRVLVRPGTLVDPETCVGLMGSTGRATGAHLHFELRFGGTPLDPLDHLELGVSGPVARIEVPSAP